MWNNYILASGRTSPPPGPIIDRLFLTGFVGTAESTGLTQNLVDAALTAQGFEPSPARVALALIHSALGISSETAELHAVTDSVNLKEELGDVCWFIAEGMLVIMAARGWVKSEDGTLVLTRPEAPEPMPIWECVMSDSDLHGLPSGDNVDHESEVYHRRLVCCAGRFADTVKSMIFYGKQETYYHPDKEGEKLAILDVALMQLRALAGTVQAWAESVEEGWFEQVLNANLAKLKARYPGKFSEAAAEHRDLEKERAVLQG